VDPRSQGVRENAAGRAVSRPYWRRGQSASVFSFPRRHSEAPEEGRAHQRWAGHLHIAEPPRPFSAPSDGPHDEKEKQLW